MQRVILRLTPVLLISALCLLSVTLVLGAHVPEGEQITLTIAGDIYLVDIDRQFSYRLIHSADNESIGAWSPDGRYLLYLSHENPYLFDTTTRQSHLLDDNPLMRYTSMMDWSPTEQAVAMIAYNANAQRFDLRRINIMTGDNQLLLGDAEANGVFWSPDGVWLALHYNNQRLSLFPMQADNNDSGLPLTLPIPGDNPTWTAGSQSIVFSSRASGRYEIYEYSINNALNQLTYDSENQLSGGRVLSEARLLFLSQRDQNSEIYQYDLNTRTETRLTDTPALKWRPQWSPDGNRIAFMSNATGTPQITVMNADGSDLRHIPMRFTIGFGVAPVWRP